MTTIQSALSRLSARLQSDPDFQGVNVLPLILQAALQDLIDAEATSRIGATPYEHTDARVTMRNGTRDKTVETPAGEVSVAIPKLRTGSFFPSLLHPRRRVDKALWSVVWPGLDQRGLHSQGRPPGEGLGVRVRDLQVRGLSRVLRHRHQRPRLPHPSPGRHVVPLRVPGRHLRPHP